MKFIHSIVKTFILSLLIIGQVNLAHAQSASTASILPPAKTTFLDQNGKPLTGGTVAFSIPGTTTPKTTWQDTAETIANTNPVVLDSAGRAIILGSGSYRQQVFDRSHNLIWDQVTMSPSGGSSGPAATGDGDLVGTIKPWAGITAPNQYMFAAGAQISRALFPALFSAITSAQPITCTSGNSTVTGLTDTTNFWIGMTVEVSCLAAGSTTITAKTSTTVTFAVAPNSNTNVVATFFPWGNGNGTTTFTLPDLRGVVIAGNNNMGGSASSRLTTSFFGATNPNSSGAFGGAQSSTLISSNLPAYTPSGSLTISNGAITSTVSGGFIGGATVTAFAGGGVGSVANAANIVVTSTQAASTGFLNGNPQGGTSTAFSNVPPTETVNYIIKTTPDQNSATSSGVTSLGLMTGDIACGTGLLCTGNMISSSGGGFPGSVSGSTQVIAQAVASGTLTLPSATDTLVGQSTTDTLLNKTLTSPNIGVINNGSPIQFLNASAAQAIESGSVCATANFTNCASTPTNGIYSSGGIAFAGSSSGITQVNATAVAIGGTVTLPQSGTLFSTTSANVVTNAILSQAGAATFKGNPTASTGNVSDFTVSGLTNIGAPNATLDLIPIFNHTTGTIQNVTPNAIATSAVAGVSSIAGNSGAFTLNGLLTNTVNVLKVTAAVKADQTTASSTTVAVVPAVQQNHPSAAKAWGFVTFSGVTPTLAANYNVTSFTRNSIGNYTVVMTTGMTSSAYAVPVSAANSASNTNVSNSATPTNATTFTILHFENATGADPLNISFTVFGTQ